MLRYEVTIERQLIRTQTQTVSVEAPDATSAFQLAEAKLKPTEWVTETFELIGETYEVECRCEDGGWSHSFTTSPNSPTPLPVGEPTQKELQDDESKQKTTVARPPS